MSNRQHYMLQRKPAQDSRAALSTNWRAGGDAPGIEGPSRPQQSWNANNRVVSQQPEHEEDYGPSFKPVSSNATHEPAAEQHEQSQQSTGTRLYVGNLVYSAQREDVYRFFSDNGFTIVKLDMSVDPMTGRNPSYAFVDLDSVGEVNRAMKELNGQLILGREVKIKPGVPKRDTTSPLNIRIKPQGKAWREENIADSYKPSFDRWTRADATHHWNKTYEESKRVFVGNLPRMEPQSAVDTAMQQLFSLANLIPTAVSKIISPHQSVAKAPGDRYYLFVDLKTAEDAEVAVGRLDGIMPSWGVRVKVRRATIGNKDRKVNREQFGHKIMEARGVKNPFEVFD